MNPRQDRNNVGQAPLPPPAPRTTAPSPSRNLVELQRRSESMPSFTKRKRMEKSQDEQRWKRTDLQLIHYMSKLKEEYIQRQNDHEQQIRKMKETDAATDEREIVNAENPTTNQQHPTDAQSKRLLDVPTIHPPTNSTKELPRSMIPVRSPPRTRTSSKQDGLANEDGAGAKRAQRPATKLPRNPDLRRAASTNSASRSEAMNDGSKFNEQELRPHQSTSKIENKTRGGYDQVTAQYSGKVQADPSDDRPRAVDLKQLDEPSAFTALNAPANLSAASASKMPQNDSRGVKKINDIQAKFLGEAMSSDFNLIQSASFKAQGPKDGRQWLQLSTLGKPRPGLATRGSMPELKALGVDRPVTKAKALSKSVVSPMNQSLKRSRWSGLILEDNKEMARKTEVTISPMKQSSRRTLLATEEPANQRKGAFRPKVSPTRPGSKIFTLKHSEEEVALKETQPTEKPEDKLNTAQRDWRAHKEHASEKKASHSLKTSASKLSAKSKQASFVKADDVSVEESFSDSDEKVAASIKETPSIIMHTKKPSFATPEPSVKKAASYKMFSPPSSVKSAAGAAPKRREDATRPSSGKSKSIKSRSPLKRESPRSGHRPVDKAQESIPSEMLRTASSSGSMSDKHRKGKRNTSGKEPAPGRRLKKFKSSLKAVPERSTSQSKVILEKNDDKHQRKTKPKSNKSVKKLDDESVQTFSTETKTSFSAEKKARDKQQRSNSKKVLSVENRYTQVESWPETSENEKQKRNHRKAVGKIPKRVTHKSRAEEKVDKKRIHKSVGGRRHRPKGLCHCRLPAVKMLGQKMGGKHRRHYRYLVDPPIYAYLGDKHNRNTTRRRRKYLVSTDESVKVYDSADTSYTSVHEVCVSETSYSMSDAASAYDDSSAEASVSGDSSYMERRTNRVAATCVSLKDSATLSWNMSESNVQIQSYSPALAVVQKVSRENRSRKAKKGQQKHRHHQDASSEKGHHRAFIMSKEIRHRCRIPVSVSSTRNHMKPVKLDQPPEGSRHRLAGGAAEEDELPPPRGMMEATQNKKTDTRLAGGASEEDENCKELDAMEAEIDQVLVKLYRSQQEIEMKLDIVEESLHQLKWNRQETLKELCQRAAKTGQTSARTKWEATYFDYFMFLTFLALQIVFQVVFIKKM